MTSATLKLLAIGSPARWQGAFASLVSHGTLAIEEVFTIHQAAARLVTEQPPFRALLLDPDALPSNQIHCLATVRRHLSIPLLILPESNYSPGGQAKAKSIRRALQAAGATPFEEISHTANLFTSDVSGEVRAVPHPMKNLPELAGVVQPAPAAHPQATSDNPPETPPANRTEIPVTGELVARYDDSRAALSDREVQALLGSAD